MNCLFAHAFCLEDSFLETEYRKYTALSFFILSALLGYVLFLFINQIGDWMRIGGSRVVFAGLSWPIISGISAGVIALILLIGFSMNAKATGFIDEVFAELHKSTWPNANETFRTTVAVTIMVGLAALVLAAMDWFWGVVFRAIL